MSNVMSEDKIEEAYELVESAVFKMSEGSELMINDKLRIVENTFADLMVKCHVEEVD